MNFEEMIERFSAGFKSVNNQIRQAYDTAAKLAPSNPKLAAWFGPSFCGAATRLQNEAEFAAETAVLFRRLVAKIRDASEEKGDAATSEN